MTGRMLGLIGLGTMGANLARNFHDRGTTLAVFDPEAPRREALARELSAVDAADHATLAAALARPRRILLMVPAGIAVDDALTRISAHLDTGDIVIDGGNSFWRDTERRAATAEGRGIRFVGLGVSGGEEGARRGPALMAGGDADALANLAPLFESIAARKDGAPCVVLCGRGGAGHFVKTVHNGIEYAVMQVLAEAYGVLRDLLGLEADAIRLLFLRWRAGDNDSFLLECAIRALGAREQEQSLIDLVTDTAEQKGTGAWSANAALEFGVAAPTLSEAVHARCVSALKRERVTLSATRTKPRTVFTGDPKSLIADLEGAVAAALLVIHAQGFALLDAASRQQEWRTDLRAVARAWRAGCIIRSQLMDRIAAESEPGALLRAEGSIAVLHERDTSWRRVVGVAFAHGLAVPALASALAYVDAMTTARLPSNLIAAQRDIFGRHGFERLDRAGRHHADWPQR
jgi:6-phosphogluconate dehydrogenase